MVRRCRSSSVGFCDEEDEGGLRQCVRKPDEEGGRSPSSEGANAESCAEVGVHGTSTVPVLGPAGGVDPYPAGC